MNFRIYPVLTDSITLTSNFSESKEVRDELSVKVRLVQLTISRG
ncbi:hypothetical protein EMIT079MI2_70109 [Bacillus sp. IT-79MI2]